MKNIIFTVYFCIMPYILCIKIDETSRGGASQHYTPTVKVSSANLECKGLESINITHYITYSRVSLWKS